MSIVFGLVTDILAVSFALPVSYFELFFVKSTACFCVLRSAVSSSHRNTAAALSLSIPLSFRIRL